MTCPTPSPPAEWDELLHRLASAGVRYRVEPSEVRYRVEPSEERQN